MKIEGGVSLKKILRNLRHGFRTLSCMNWVSGSGFHVAGLLGAVGLILAIRDCKVGDLSSLRWFSERANRSEELWLVPGLQNLGNNCFLNVILQALASCSYFQHFLQKVIEECQLSVDEEQVASLPLAAALATLLEELCEVGGRRVVLSPRKVMLAMAHYIPNFNLTAQQDAAEAFLHLLSSLREEFSDCYFPNQCSLVDVCASSCRILNPKRREDLTEQERWQQQFLGPFDGILGSILTCQSCSSQISLSFESFRSLPLSPVLNNGAHIIVGSTLEDCLKQFIIAEHVENYHCSHCWHIAGIKYLSSVGANEMEIEKLRVCSEQEDCDCQRLLHLETLPWSNNFSYTLKQLSIARCPKILCIHLKRVSINMFGEPVKLQGHISFPLILDLFPFMTSGVGIKSSGENLRRKKVTLQCEKPKPLANHLSVQFDSMKLNYIYGLSRENVHSKELDPDESHCSVNAQGVQGEINSAQTEGSPKSMPTIMHMQSDYKVTVPLETHLYRLVSVVEHFGRAASGHYTVYRSVRADSNKEKEVPDDQFEPDNESWFCISDFEVHNVSEKDVLDAEASLLFYEKIV
ncbi:ubiquitin carboxyl-terminal hydrolase 27 [Corylus avellana]|uniref:ubiquitin carboxyl-terminal hydrolase 27 n=1 Tax=Corylus avellana TaxID=13451 RepID=UPI00286B3BFF|nr:ubiquitin carboxyl-terminal hydrolase 27 [Corylus avellana]